MKTYKNISKVDQLGIEPGETGERDISRDKEFRMTERGAIEVVEKVQTPPPSPVSTPPANAKPKGD